MKKMTHESSKTRREFPAVQAPMRMVLGRGSHVPIRYAGSNPGRHSVFCQREPAAYRKYSNRLAVNLRACRSCITSIAENPSPDPVSLLSQCPSQQYVPSAKRGRGRVSRSLILPLVKGLFAVQLLYPPTCGTHSIIQPVTCYLLRTLRSEGPCAIMGSLHAYVTELLRITSKVTQLRRTCDMSPWAMRAS
jgi:hypothetical protein